ncbi:20046_t:CDS:2 [Gigaspora margarita]|uniref:20046_t:CDS:1 n=1 Tax=Gigaspora margarita TaxID=4874 RepID=A0ABN7W0B7_GIGMA|nr:20046_t:CDS:2 [Gigaspora margarita]
MGEGQFYENVEDIHYGYSKLSPDELEIAPRQYPVPEIVSFPQIPQGNFTIFVSYNFQCNEHPMSCKQLFPQIEPSLLIYGQTPESSQLINQERDQSQWANIPQTNAQWLQQIDFLSAQSHPAMIPPIDIMENRPDIYKKWFINIETYRNLFQAL